MSFWDEFKKITQPYADDEDYDDYDDEDMDDGYEEEPAPRFGSRRETPPASDNGFGAVNTPPASPAFSTAGPASTGAAPSGFSGTVLNTGASAAKQQVVLSRPKVFGDSSEMANNLRNKKAVVLNLEGVDKSLARRVVDFLTGCVYVLDGSVKKISQATYLFCPYNMEILGDLKDLQSEIERYN